METDYEIAARELDELWNSLGIASTLSGPLPAVRDGRPQLHFSLAVNGQSFDYFMGIGHVDKERYSKARSNPFAFKLGTKDEPMLNTLHAGKTPKDHAWAARVACACFDKGKSPKAAEIIGAVAREAQAHDQTFEDWASEYGYDQDSRKAEQVYNECVTSWHKLRKIGLSSDQINRLAELASQL